MTTERMYRMQAAAEALRPVTGDWLGGEQPAVIGWMRCQRACDVRMTTSKNARQEPTTGDGLVGISTLGVALLDSALLVAYLIGLRQPGWESAFQLWSVVTFLLAQMLLGLAACTGIVLRSMGARSGIASRWLPFVLMVVRTVLVMAAMPLSRLFSDSEAASSVAFMSFYCTPATLLLLVISLVGLTRHRSAAQN